MPGWLGLTRWPRGVLGASKPVQARLRKDGPGSAMRWGDCITIRTDKKFPSLNHLRSATQWSCWSGACMGSNSSILVIIFVQNHSRLIPGNYYVIDLLTIDRHHHRIAPDSEEGRQQAWSEHCHHQPIIIIKNYIFCGLAAKWRKCSYFQNLKEYWYLHYVIGHLQKV